MIQICILLKKKKLSENNMPKYCNDISDLSITLNAIENTRYVDQGKLHISN